MNERVERMFGARESWGKGERIATAPAGPRNDTQAPGTAEGVKGFVSIRCGGCGRTINTCLHEKRTIFNCKGCGHPNPLEHLKTMKVECPRCNFRGLYQTNREESPIVMECLNCSQPVQRRRGKRRGNYVTVREERR